MQVPDSGTYVPFSGTLYRNHCILHTYMLSKLENSHVVHFAIIFVCYGLSCSTQTMFFKPQKPSHGQAPVTHNNNNKHQNKRKRTPQSVSYVYPEYWVCDAWNNDTRYRWSWNTCTSFVLYSQTKWPQWTQFVLYSQAKWPQWTHLYCIHKQNDLSEHICTVFTNKMTLVNTVCTVFTNKITLVMNEIHQTKSSQEESTILIFLCVCVFQVLFLLIRTSPNTHSLTHSHSHKENILSLLIRRWAERLALSVPTCMIERHEDIQNNIYYTAWSNKST